MSETGDALLSQILTEVRATRAQVAGIEITVAQAVAEIRHRAEQADDHETRLRALEARDVVTSDALAASQAERFRKTVAVLTVGLTLLALVESAVIALLVRG